MGFWRGCSQMAGAKSPLPKICHTYPTMMKLGTVIPYLRRIKKKMNHMTQPLSSSEINIFSPKIKILFYQEIQM